VAHGTTHDPAQDIAASLIRWQDAVGDQEGRAAQMVGDDPMAGAFREVLVLEVLLVGFMFYGV
jgi:hypothetical protein